MEICHEKCTPLQFDLVRSLRFSFYSFLWEIECEATAYDKLIFETKFFSSATPLSMYYHISLNIRTQSNLFFDTFESVLKAPEKRLHKSGFGKLETSFVRDELDAYWAFA